MHKIQISEFDITKYLKDDKAIAEYLSAVLEDNDTALFMQAFQHVIRIKGIAQLSHATGLSKESIEAVLMPGAEPRFETVLKLMTAAGFKLIIQPAM